MSFIKKNVSGAKSQLAWGDYLEGLASVPKGSVDLLLTQTPFNPGLRLSMSRSEMLKEQGKFLPYNDPKCWEESMHDFFALAARAMRTGASAIVFMHPLRAESFVKIAAKYGFVFQSAGEIFRKETSTSRQGSAAFSDDLQTWVFFTLREKYSVSRKQKKMIRNMHIVQKDSGRTKSYRPIPPMEKMSTVMTRFIEILTEPGDVVLDPFMGSGTIGVAAIAKKRMFFGVETSQMMFSSATSNIRNMEIKISRKPRREARSV